MPDSLLTRRQFNRWLASCLLASGSRVSAGSDQSKPQPASRLRAAAIQMSPKLGDVHANLNQAEFLIRRAIRRGAQWIMLPEFFTSAMAFHPDMLDAIQPIDGVPFQFLKRLAREGNVIIGGSFLARHDQEVFNTYVLVFPDGGFVHHNKDHPTYWETCYYKRGKDDGVLSSPVGPVGSALCWEFIRSDTARRLHGKVKMVVGGSCWWTLPEEIDPASPNWAVNLKMLQEAPVRMARMLGVPVIHGSHAGHFEGFLSPELPDVAYNSAYLGETMIVDAAGQVLARRGREETEGVIVAEIQLPDRIEPSETIPETFWIPEDMPQEWQESWERWFDRGEDYYQMVTAQYLETGVINEYEPEYLR